MLDVNLDSTASNLRSVTHKNYLLPHQNAIYSKVVYHTLWFGTAYPLT